MGHLIKNIKQFSYQTDGAAYDEFVSIAKKYRNAKNYIYSRYSGIESLLLLQNTRKNIRDVWTENGFLDNWGINRRYLRNAIEDATSNIKTNWGQCFKRVKEHVINSDVFNDKQKHFIFYVLKSDKLMHQILTTHQFKVPEKFEAIKNDIPLLIEKICNLVRQHKAAISHTDKLTMLLDDMMYSYSEDKTEIFVMGLVKNKRIGFKLTTKNAFTGTIRISIAYDVITISSAIESETRPLNAPDAEENKIGTDKNYVNMLDTSTDQSYGKGFGVLQTEITKELREKNRKRGVYRSKIKELLKENEEKPKNAKKNNKKIDSITKFNLGNKKYDRNKNRHDENKRKVINSSINKFVKTEMPTIIVAEDLTKAIKSKKPRTKNVKHILSSWVKGDIQERLTYITKKHEITLSLRNAAYTSQTCSKCGSFGVKLDDKFYCDNTKCVNHGGVHSGHEAARQTLSRDDDSEITLNMSHIRVKEILKKRLADKMGDENPDEPSQPRPPAKSRKERSVQVIQ